MFGCGDGSSPPLCSHCSPQRAVKGTGSHSGPRYLWSLDQTVMGWKWGTEHWVAPPETEQSHLHLAQRSPASAGGAEVQKRTVSLCVLHGVCLCVCVSEHEVRFITFFRRDRWQQLCRRRSSRDRMWTVLEACWGCLELEAESAWDKPNSWATAGDRSTNTFLIRQHTLTIKSLSWVRRYCLLMGLHH